MGGTWRRKCGNLQHATRSCPTNGPGMLSEPSRGRDLRVQERDLRVRDRELGVRGRNLTWVISRCVNSRSETSSGRMMIRPMPPPRRSTPELAMRPSLPWTVRTHSFPWPCIETISQSIYSSTPRVACSERRQRMRGVRRREQHLRDIRVADWNARVRGHIRQARGARSSSSCGQFVTAVAIAHYE